MAGNGKKGVIRPTTLDVQLALVKHGYVIIADGNPGPKTRIAIMEFQSDNGLFTDGFAGLETLEALGLTDDEEVKECDCNKIMFAFPQINHVSIITGAGDLIVKEGKLKQESEALRRLREGTEAWLKIPYDYSIKCTGKYKSECNAEVKVQAKPIGQWTVKTVKEEKGGTSTKSWEVNSSKIHLKIEPITCSGKCDEEGKPNEIQKRELEIDVSVDNYTLYYLSDPGRVDNLKGKFELTFTPRYCEEIEFKKRIGKAGRLINRITVEVDIQSEK